MAMAASSKHIVQILQLLTERGLTFSFCLNKEELLVLSGFGLLYQGLDLDESSKVLKDNQKMLVATISQLDKMKAASASDFRRVACSFLPISVERPTGKSKTSSRHGSDGSMPAPPKSTIPSVLKQHFKAMAAKASLINHNSHRATAHPKGGPYRQSMPTLSLPNLARTMSSNARASEPARSPHNMIHHLSPKPNTSAPLRSANDVRHAPPRRTNLDYLSFSAESTPPPRPTPSSSASGSSQHQQQLSKPTISVKPEPTDWERLLGSLDNGQAKSSTAYMAAHRSSC